MNKLNSTKAFLNADEVAEDLCVAKSTAYKLLRKLNDELELKGFITISGKISTKYFQERIYGINQEFIRKELSYAIL